MNHKPQPLLGVSVLIPRAPGRGQKLAHRIEAAGGQAVLAPLISRGPLNAKQSEELQVEVKRLLNGEYAWTALTSVNAIFELEKAANNLGQSLPEAQTKWAAVGPATAHSLKEKGIEPEFVAPHNSALGMLAVWPKAQSEQEKVLLPLGNLAAATLEEGLVKKGYDPVRVTAYHTLSHPAPPEVISRWRGGNFDAVILTSGSVVRELHEQFGIQANVGAIAIGEPTKKAALELHQPVLGVAVNATDDALFDALLQAVPDIHSLRGHTSA